MTAKNDIKYILVETVLNDKDKPISELVKTSKIGLLKGIQYRVVSTPDKEEPFLLLKSKNDALLSMNLNFHNILSIEKFNDLYKTMTYFRAGDEEQESAIAKILKLTEDFKKAGNTLKSNKELIDTEKYSSVPSTFKSGESSDSKTTGVGSGTGKSSSIYSPTRSHTPARSTSYNKPKKPTLFKRKSKMPTKAMLELMEEKLKDIRDGKFEPKLPKIALDPPGVNDAVEDDDDYHAAYFQG